MILIQDTVRKKLEESLSSIRPYLSEASFLESEIENAIDNSVDVDEAIKYFEKNASEENDPTKKADYRILLNELRRK